MPNLQEVEQFKSILNELGDEPEILAERDEEIEDIPPPEQGMPEGLSELLESPEGAPGAATVGGSPTGEEAGVPGGAQGVPFPEAPEEQAVDLSDLLGEEDLSGLDILEGIELPEGEEEARAPLEEEAPEEVLEEAPEAAPEAAEAGPMEEFAEAPEQEEAPGQAEIPPEEILLEDFDFELPEVEAPEAGEGEEGAEPWEVPEVEAPGAEESAEPWEGAEAAAPEAPSPEGEVDEFTIPPELLEGQAAEEISEAPEAEFELPEEFAAFEAEQQAEVAPAETPEFALPTEEPAEPAGEAAEEAFDFELPEPPEAPEGREEIGAEELPEMPGFDLEAFDAEAFEPPEDAFGEEVSAEEAATEKAEEEPLETSEEEAEFLRVLQDQILPEAAPEAGPPFEAEEEAQPVEAAEAPAEEPARAPGAGEIPEEISLEEEGGFLEAGFPAAGAEAPGEPEGEHIDLEAPSGIPEDVEEYALDEFSLEGLGVEEEAPAPPPPEEEIPAAAPEVREQFPEEIAVPAGEELTFTDRQFTAIKRTLSALPRNLKIAVEELIAEKGLEGEELRSLLALLIEGAAPTAIAGQVSRLTGQRIALPKGLERLTGIAFEQRRRTFGYAFRENIVPIVRVVLLSLLVLGVLSFLGYRYVYEPLYANYLYRQGYRQIEKERYRMANDSFDRATSVWAFKNWFFRYAEGFTEHSQFQLAAEKYEQLLRRFPRDRRGKIAYASLLTFHLAGYEKADKLLGEVLAVDMKDYDALLARGDNYLEWAEEDESRYADARFAYASVIDYYGEKEEVLLRMLRYFVRTDKYDETRTLKAYLDDRGSGRVDPELYASTYAELAGYWIDKGNYDSVPDMLFKAMGRKMNDPDIHYQLARYYRRVQDPLEEETALKAAIELLERMQPLDKKHLFMVIDCYNRRGETFWRKEEYLEAEEHFRKAIARIEDAQSRRIFGEREEFGLAYKNYGDIFYYVSHDLEPALDLYLKALNNRYQTPELNYKIGYVHYAADRYEDALLSFSKVVDQRPSNENALYALANSLYLRGYYSSAQGYYLRLLNLLEGREERIPFLQIYDNPEHSALVEYIMKVYNNLGVTLKQLADRSRDPEKESKALVNMTFSSERFDLLTRDPLTVERGLTKNLAYLNQGGILYPSSDFQLQIYTRLPVDLQASRF